MDPLIALIGLDADVQGAVTPLLKGRSIHYPMPPRMYSVDGALYVESAKVQEKWLRPQGVIFYGYFPKAQMERRAMALSNTPTFPDVQATIQHDDKAISLMLAMKADPCPVGVPRGFIPNHTATAVKAEQVFKWGDAHCGHNKARGTVVPAHSSTVEPFIEGLSERILVVGTKAWHLRYHSTDWRKNVGGTVEEVVPADWPLISRTLVITQNLGLAVAGVDYVRPLNGAPPVLLEVNAYPELSQGQGAIEAFAALARAWEAEIDLS